ncbi:hypothetical protein CAPTEDRAFT_190824, partial [Capitella teleta]
MERIRIDFCYDRCVTEWSQWSSCSAECGGGTRTRSRRIDEEDYCKGLPNTKRNELLQSAPCNPVCEHGATRLEQGGCLCPPGRTGTCCHTEITCNYPGRPMNGDLEMMQPLVYGRIISFSCDEGYVMTDGDIDIVCNGQGKWNGTKPTCTAKMVGQAIAMGMKSCTHVILATNLLVLQIIHYSCSEGYRLRGSSQSTCLSNGKWSGNTRECDPIWCEPPIEPVNGKLLPPKSKYYYGQAVGFSCEPGFIMEGVQKLRCRERGPDSPVVIGSGGGEWNGEAPTCTAVSCGDPGPPQNGAKDGSIFYFPHSVVFSCYAGYILQGASEVQCTEGGTWSAPPPACIPCPKNTYKNNGRLDTECLACPPNSHTVTAASTSQAQCLCDQGYRSDENGVCREVRCPILSAVEHGNLASCDNVMGSVCEMTCEDGYILSSGSGKRQCLGDGSWSGSQPRCQPCGMNTYKEEGGNVCLPCPLHSHTNAVAQQKGDAGGPCEDVDECAANSGRGDCEDTCKNLDGGYECSCTTVPVDKTCTNLTTDDAPENGGLVCHWYREQNSQYCSLRCNDGYEFFSGINKYETCGATTGYEWSFEVRNETIPDCYEEYFPGFRLEADAFYFVRKCKDLTPSEQDDVKKTFAAVLDDNQVCKLRGTKLCNLDNFGIICGNETLRRRKRSTDGQEYDEEVSEVKIQLEVRGNKVLDSSTEANRICALLRIPRSRCTVRIATEAYKRYLKAAVMFSGNQLKSLFRRPER